MRNVLFKMTENPGLCPSTILLFTRKVRCMMAVKIEIPRHTKKLQLKVKNEKHITSIKTITLIAELWMYFEPLQGQTHFLPLSNPILI